MGERTSLYILGAVPLPSVCVFACCGLQVLSLDARNGMALSNNAQSPRLRRCSLLDRVRLLFTRLLSWMLSCL